VGEKGGGARKKTRWWTCEGPMIKKNYDGGRSKNEDKGCGKEENKEFIFRDEK